MSATNFAKGTQMQVKMKRRRAGRGNRHEVTKVREFYYDCDVMSELVSDVSAGKENSFAE
jgi:hypothetical protein